MSKIGKIINILQLIMLTGLGVLFLLAAPAGDDSNQQTSRMITGVTLIIVGIVIFAVISYSINKGQFKVVKITETFDKEKFVPNEVICPNCRNRIIISDDIKRSDVIVCEKCGEEIEIPKDSVNW